MQVRNEPTAPATGGTEFKRAARTVNHSRSRPDYNVLNLIARKPGASSSFNGSLLAEFRYSSRSVRMDGCMQGRGPGLGCRVPMNPPIEEEGNNELFFIRGCDSWIMRPSAVLSTRMQQHYRSCCRRDESDDERIQCLVIPQAQVLFPFVLLVLFPVPGRANQKSKTVTRSKTSKVFSLGRQKVVESYGMIFLRDLPE